MTSLPRFSVQNPVLVNLFMITVLVAGGYSALTIIREMFPESRPNQIIVTTLYPGATPAEIEKGITLKIEEQIKDVDGVDKLLSTINEGISTIVVELESGFDDIDQAVNDVKAAIDTIPPEDFPEDAKETSVVKFDPRWPVINVTIYGDRSDRELKALGERLREDLLDLHDVTDVVLSGTRKDEISVDVRPEKLAEYGLSFMEVAAAIRASNLDVPGGQVRTPRANVSVRTLGEEDRGEALTDIVIRSNPAGDVVRLDDVATIVDGFEDVDVLGRFDGRPAVSAIVYKTPEQDAIQIASMVKAMVAGKMGRPLERPWQDRFVAMVSGRDHVRDTYEAAKSDPYPQGVGLALHNDLSVFVEGRLDLLKRNGLWGLILVTLSLLTFLHWRVAFWVMMGLLLAIAGSVVCMKLLGQTLNLITMFGLIIVLGLLVDDAIIVAEHVYSKIEAGMEPGPAAIVGTEAVTWPVVCAILTTIVAFVPLMFIEGRIGDWMGVLPVVVCVALSVSLLEALTILPSHLAHGLRPLTAERVRRDLPSMNMGMRIAARIRSTQQKYAQQKLQAAYEWLLRLAVRYRYVTVAALTASMLIVVGAVLGDHVPFVFLQKMDSETVVANVKMGVGTPVDRTLDAVKVVENAALQAPETRSVYTIVGRQLSDSGLHSAPQSHLGQVFIELAHAEDRDRTSDELVQAFRSQTNDIPGVQKLSWSSIQGGPAGAPFHLEISGDRLDDLIAASEIIRERLLTYDGVYDIVDDFDAGRREVQISLYDSARALGLTTASLATQVRSAFYGFEARKVQRGREDVKIMVRYPPSYREHIYDIESMRVATPSGALVPFTEVAALTETTGFASIKRKDQHRTVTVTADIDSDVTNSDKVIAAVAKGFPKLADRFPGISFEFGGQKLETRRSFASLNRDFFAALLLIYAILAGLFRSYIQPLIVMAVIPFGLIGAVVGHHVMGYPLTILSMIGLVALTGIVVNDSMILVTFINGRIEEGANAVEAVIAGGKSRLRPILLTSATTVLGIAPLLAERSFQAKFLIPMGISISAGLIFATVLTLVAVPSLYLMVLDTRRTARALIAVAFRRADRSAVADA